MGDIALFGSHAEDPVGAAMAFDVGDAVHALQAAGKWTRDVSLTFVRGGPPAPRGPPFQPPAPSDSRRSA